MQCHTDCDNSMPFYVNVNLIMFELGCAGTYTSFQSLSREVKLPLYIIAMNYKHI